MKRSLLFSLLCASLLPALAVAEEPQSEEQRLVELRKSGSHQRGLMAAREKIDLVYDMGAVQGASRWEALHAYYRSCVSRANDAAHEPACANASKAWSEALLKRLRKQLEAHGLPAGKKPE